MKDVICQKGVNPEEERFWNKSQVNCIHIIVNIKIWDFVFIFMREYEEKLKEIITSQDINAVHLSFDELCRSVTEAASTVDAGPEDFVKSIVMVDREGNVIIGIVKGEDRVSTSRVGKVLGIDRPRIASPDEILGLTGFPLGGTPGFGFKATFLVDTRVLEKEKVYLGGGSEYALTYMPTDELVRVNRGRIARIRK